MVARKVAIIGLSATLVVAVATIATIILVLNKPDGDGNDNRVHSYINESQKAIQEFCRNTYYHRTCIDTLSKATNSSDPQSLIQAGFRTAIHELGHVIEETFPLQKASSDPTTASAYKTCRKLLDDSVYDLQMTIDRIGMFDAADFDELLDDIKTWLTGALTYQETCLDCFEDVKGDDGKKMRELLKLSRELTINGLAIANEFTDILVPAGIGRRLMAHTGDKFKDYDYDYDYRGKQGGRRVLMMHTGDKFKDYDYDYDYRGKQGGRRVLMMHTGDKFKDYDYDYRGKQGGRRVLMMHTGDKFKDYDYDYDYIGKQGGRNLLEAGPGRISPNVIVAKDGSGKYKTINEALKDVPQKSNNTFVIYIKEGVYEEYVTVNRTSWSVMFVGDGPTKTKITGNRSKIGGWDTFWTATVAIEGDNFIAKDIGFENTAGSAMHQAIALRVSADKAIFHNCQIDGFQDTLYAHNHRQYYRDCTISGTIDFIFGNARAVLQNCTLLVRKPLEDQKLCMVTAQGRTSVNETSAVVLQNCRILPGPDYPVADKSYRAYLGRPWKEFSRAIVMDSEIDGLIDPDGWSSWNGTSAHLDTCWYAEVNNVGPGADVTRRVKWPGIKRISMREAERFTPKEYMLGDLWIVGKGIPYHSGRTTK